MDNGAFYARTTVACFKPGRREQANAIIEGILKKWMDGYRGYIIHSDLDNPDRAIYTTFWDSEEAMVRALGELDDGTLRELEELSLGVFFTGFTRVEDHWLHLDP